jgi:energy-converting hydrogenase Eha subunit C
MKFVSVEVVCISAGQHPLEAAVVAVGVVPVSVLVHALAYTININMARLIGLWANFD